MKARDDEIGTVEAAEILDILPDSVRALRRRGVLPAVRVISGIYIFSRTTVERLARTRFTPPDGARTQHRYSVRNDAPPAV